MGRVRRAGIGALAGAVAGIAAGAGARVSMRMLADGFPDNVIQGSAVFTIAGTAVILVFGAVIGAPAGVIYEFIAERIPGPHTTRGLILSALFLALVTPLLLAEGAELLFTSPRLIVLLLPFVLYGVTLGLVRAPRRRAV